MKKINEPKFVSDIAFTEAVKNARKKWGHEGPIK